MSRQNYYAVRKQRQAREIESDVVLSLTRRERVFQPRLGARKTLRLISEEIADVGIKLGRDRYFSLLRDNDMLVRPKPRKPKTTNSQHNCYENALAERVNGILKQEYEMDGYFRTKSQARKAFEQAVFLYNNRCPRTSIGIRFRHSSIEKGQKPNQTPPASPRFTLRPSGVPFGDGFCSAKLDTQNNWKRGGFHTYSQTKKRTRSNF